MSAGKLDQSLDEILKTGKTSRRGRGARRSGAGRPAPVGGVQKTTKQAKAAPTAPAAAHGSGESKIMISNLVSFRELRMVP